MCQVTCDSPLMISRVEVASDLAALAESHCRIIWDLVIVVRWSQYRDHRRPRLSILLMRLVFFGLSLLVG